MRKRTLICILLLLAFIALTATACIDGDGSAGGANSAAANSTPMPYHLQVTRSADATATFAADQFNQQLTAIADQKNNP